MGYLGNIPTAVPIQSSDLADGIVSNAKLGTDISAAKLVAGTLADARFPATLPSISGANLTNLPGGGKVLQVVQATNGGNSTANTTNTSFTTAEVLGTTITVTKGNKVLFFANGIQWSNTGTNNYNGELRVSLSDGSNTATTNATILQNQNAGFNIIRMYGTNHAGLLTTASGSGTVTVTATVQFKAENSSANHVYYGDTNTGTSFGYTFMEISV